MYCFYWKWLCHDRWLATSSISKAAEFFSFHMHEGQDNQLHYPILHRSVYWEENLKSPSDTQVPLSGDWAHENPL